MERMDGKALSLEWRQGVRERAGEFEQKHGIKPCLAVVLVGDDPASQVYVSHKIKACEEAGIKSLENRLPAGTTQESLESLISDLNGNAEVHGILVQLPLPKHLNKFKAIEKISPLKDADGLCVENMGLLMSGKKRVAPCTPYGVIQLLKKYQIPMTGTKAVVVGRSQIVGKPMALLLIEENATVTLCHSRTKDLRAELKQADIVVVAAGKPEFLGADDFKEGAVVIDVGIHRKADGKLCGDVRTKELDGIAKAVTPVPGGVGPMTIAMLLENTLILAEHSILQKA